MNLLITVSAEQQQLVTENKRLTSDKEDLIARLQCCEEDLKTANECESYSHYFYEYAMYFYLVSMMREKALMAAADKRHSGVKELVETIKQNSVSDIAVQNLTLPVSNVQQLSVYICFVCSSRLAGSFVEHLMVMYSMLITVSAV